MKKLLLFLSVLLLGIGMAIPCYGWHLPDIKTGLALRTQKRVGITITKSIELYQINFSDSKKVLNFWIFKYPVRNLGDWAFDLQLGQDLIALSFSYIVVPIVDIQIGAYFGYDFADNGYETGLCLAMIIW